MRQVHLQDVDLNLLLALHALLAERTSPAPPSAVT